MRHWLIKSEPGSYSIDDLQRDGRTCWDGVRNYTARNMMRDEMQAGDLVLFYHSNADPPAVVGVARVAGPAYADPTQFDPTDPHYDPKATPDAPRWMLVDFEFVEKLPRAVGLPQLKDDAALDGMELLRKGSRLSVQPVSPEHYARVLDLARS